MGPDDIAGLAHQAHSEAVAALGDDAEGNEIALYVMGVDDEVVHAIGQYMMHGIHQSLFEHMMGGNHPDGMSPSDVIQYAIQACVPTVLMIGRQIWKNNSGSSTTIDQYMSTVATEIRLSNLISDGRDLSEIWPSEYTTEIVNAFDGDPAKAFIAGVMCGRNDG